MLRSSGAVWRGRRKWPFLGLFCLNLWHAPESLPDSYCWVRRVFPVAKLSEKFEFGVRLKIWGVQHVQKKQFCPFSACIFLVLTKTTPKVNDGVKRVACHPHQVKEHKKLVNWRGWYLATSCGFIGKSWHMCLKKVHKCPKINKNCLIWRCYAPYTSNLTSNFNFSFNFGTWDNVRAN